MGWDILLFDLDGTLTDSGPGIMHAAKTALQSFGIDGEAALRVTYPDGTAGVIASGEVSVRGMYGYT